MCGWGKRSCEIGLWSCWLIGNVGVGWKELGEGNREAHWCLVMLASLALKTKAGENWHPIPVIEQRSAQHSAR